MDWDNFASIQIELEFSRHLFLLLLFDCNFVSLSKSPVEFLIVHKLMTLHSGLNLVAEKNCNKEN